MPPNFNDVMDLTMITVDRILASDINMTKIDQLESQFEFNAMKELRNKAAKV